MSIFITGAAGFIGSNVAEALAEVGHDVVGVDNFDNHYSPDLKQANAEAAKSAGAKITEQDIADSIQLPEDTDVVIHFAAQPGIDDSVPFGTYERNNILATQTLLTACHRLESAPFFLNISTSSVYGLEATGQETAEPKPASDYGVTKLAAEQLVLSHSRQDKLDAASLRLFSVYGPRERPEKLFTKLIQAAVTDQLFPLYEGSREHVRAFTYVGDVVKAIKQALQNQEAINGEIINIGSDNTRTTGEAIQAVERAVGKEIEMDMQPPRAGDQNKTSAQIEKAKELLDYEPSTSLKEGVKKQVEWFKENNIQKLL